MANLRKMLGDWKQPEIQLIMKLIETQSKTTITNFCINYTEKELLPIYKQIYPNDNRLEITLEAARAWLRGEKKLPEVKSLILNSCHAAAREADNPIAQAVARAISQAASTIHVATHALGIAFYGATAKAYNTAGLKATKETYNKLATEEFINIYNAFKLVSIKNEPHPVKVNWNC